MFAYDPKIPRDFAMAVYGVLHGYKGTAVARLWEIIDDAPEAMLWIESIYNSNKEPFTADERKWWLSQLSARPDWN